MTVARGGLVLMPILFLILVFSGNASAAWIPVLAFVIDLLLVWYGKEQGW